MTAKTSILRLSAIVALATISSGAFAQIPHWLRTYSSGPSSVETAVGMLSDAAGNVYTVGTTDGDVLVVSYTSAGVFRWANTYAGPGGGIDRPVEAVLDNSGDVVVVGDGSRTPTQNAFMALKFSGITGGLVWSQLYYENDLVLGEVSGPAKGVCIGPGGFIYACGAIQVFNEFYDALTLRISPTTGVVVNTATYGLPAANSQIAEDIAWDGAGGLYVTGSTADNELPLSSSGSDLLLAKYNGALGTVWIRTFDGHGLADYGRSVACRRSLNSVYIMGNTEASNLNTPYLEVAVLRVNSISGGQVWQKSWLAPTSFPTSSDMHSGEMVLDRFGYLNVVSWSSPGVVHLAKLASTNGALRWGRDVGGQDVDIVVDASTNVILAGGGIAKFGADGVLWWVNTEPTAACTVGPTGVVYTAGSRADDLATIRWNQAAYAITVTPDHPLGGTIVTCQIRSALPAPPEGLTFALGDWYTRWLLGFPESVTIPAGQTSVNFPIYIAATRGYPYYIEATWSGGTVGATISPVVSSFKSFTVTPNTIKGGGSVIGTVKMDSIVWYGFTFLPTSDSPFCVPGTGGIWGNTATSKPFPVYTLPVTTATLVTLTVTDTSVYHYGGTVTTTLTITP